MEVGVKCLWNPWLKNITFSLPKFISSNLDFLKITSQAMPGILHV